MCSRNHVYCDIIFRCRSFSSLDEACDAGVRSMRPTAHELLTCLLLHNFPAWPQTLYLSIRLLLSNGPELWDVC